MAWHATACTASSDTCAACTVLPVPQVLRRVWCLFEIWKTVEYHDVDGLVVVAHDVDLIGLKVRGMGALGGAWSKGRWSAWGACAARGAGCDGMDGSLVVAHDVDLIGLKVRRKQGQGLHGARAWGAQAHGRKGGWGHDVVHGLVAAVPHVPNWVHRGVGASSGVGKGQGGMFAGSGLERTARRGTNTSKGSWGRMRLWR